ncbi:hypothetical protein B484DRAFT_409774 [Ochromonadaceae sp. CCMP2298]|nr:hypothetical protein B484DRAFT_409774 [Ochromonadaceae sp. CCMP2298]
MSSAMIAPPHPLEQAYRCGIFLSFAFGAACSVPSLWERFFQKMDGTPLGGAYARVGEYGETEIKVLWSSFKEPINAWSSLAYCVFGIVICVVGTYDYFEYAHVDAPNRMAQDNGFSVMIGSFLMYLGLTSFLFHASHSADWWKANNGMTSGVMIPLVLFAVWDRVRLPGMHSTIVLSFCSFLLFSLTYGYTPPWSLDLLFPLSVAIVVFSELCPRYGGALHADQYMYFCQCMLCASGGALLRAVDLYRNNTRTRQILLLCYALGLGVYCLLSSFTDDIALCGMVCGALVLFNPARGHACWHWASAYAVYLWWYMLRTRPGNPRTPYGLDRVLVSLLLFAALKNALRRIIMKLPARILAPDYHDRVRLTLEHLVFSLWGYYSIVVVPTQNQSWLYHTVLCWYTPTYPTPGFTLYYIARVAALVEDGLGQG